MDCQSWPKRQPPDLAILSIDISTTSTATTSETRSNKRIRLFLIIVVDMTEILLVRQVLFRQF